MKKHNLPFKLENNTGVLIKKAARLFEQVANKDLDNLGVTYAQTTFLIRLWEHDGQNQMELANNAGLKQPTVVRTLDRMERDELITRLRNPNDRRIFNFFLTPKAKKICQKLETYANRMHSISTDTITQHDAEKLNLLLLKVIRNLQSSLSS